MRKIKNEKVEIFSLIESQNKQIRDMILLLNKILLFNNSFMNRNKKIWN